MRTFILGFGILILFHSTCLSVGKADSVTLNQTVYFSLKAGLLYKNFFGKKYIELRTNHYPFAFQRQYQFDGFTKEPSFGFQTGVLVFLKIYKPVYFSTGLLISLRKDIYSGNKDSVVEYPPPASIHDIVKYNYSYYSLEIPLMISCKIKRLGLFLGVDLPILSLRSAEYTYIPNVYDSLTNKRVTSYLYISTFFPLFQVSYDFKIRNIWIQPFLGIEFGSNSAFYLMGGINIPLLFNHSYIETK